MKNLYKIAFGITISMLMGSCSKYEALDFHVDKPASFEAQEQIDAYGTLKSYLNKDAHPNFKFGAAVSLSDYVGKGVMYRLINSNFNEIVLGYEMKHGAVVKADGSLALDNVKDLLKAAHGAGLAVYGHTLCWHANQNASYLNGLISPKVVEVPSLLDLSGLKDGSMNGWVAGGAAAKSVADGAGMGGGKALKLTSSSTAKNAWDLNIRTPAIPINVTKSYVVTFNIKSDKPGKGRISFSADVNSQYPWIDWVGLGAKEAFETTTAWQKVSFVVSGFKPTATSFTFNFDLGYLPDVTYSIDVSSMTVMDAETASGLEANQYQNADFEGADLKWAGNTGATLSLVAGKGVNGSKALAATNSTVRANAWEAQFYYRLDPRMKAGDQYELKMDIKADVATTFGSQYHGDIGQYLGGAVGDIAVTTAWTTYTKRFTVSSSNSTDVGAIAFDIGKTATTFYFDNVSLRRVNPNGGGTQLVEKTPAEKKTLITNALTRFISGMVDTCKTYVKAWDVVNEPMDDGNPHNLKSGVGKTLKADEFYWQDYLGKDYAVDAFKIAKQHANADDLLFINDYNLEYNLEKCKGLIEYVQYIEGKGAKVDGIGTQMHISITSDKQKIADMFTLLAATGKKIKVSELDMGVGVKTTAATAENYAAQEEMYKYVFDKYFELIPANQQYGITIWSPLDSPASSSWRAGEPIGLWTEGMVRKPAYRGVADGLKGK